MRNLTVSDQAWIKAEGGTPWTIIALENSTATIANGKQTRQVSTGELKLVRGSLEREPSGKIPESMLSAALAFVQHFPKRIAELDLHPIHEEELKAHLVDAPAFAKPEQKIPNGTSIKIGPGGACDGEVGEILCYDPRANCYTVRCEKANYLLVLNADRVEALTTAAAQARRKTPQQNAHLI